MKFKFIILFILLMCITSCKSELLRIYSNEVKIKITGEPIIYNYMAGDTIVLNIEIGNYSSEIIRIAPSTSPFRLMNKKHIPDEYMGPPIPFFQSIDRERALGVFEIPRNATKTLWVSFAILDDIEKFTEIGQYVCVFLNRQKEKGKILSFNCQSENSIQIDIEK